MQLHIAYKKLDKPWRNKGIVSFTLACQCRRQNGKKDRNCRTLETLQSLLYRPWFLTFPCPCFRVKRSPLHFCRSIERRLGGEDKGHAHRGSSETLPTRGEMCARDGLGFRCAFWEGIVKRAFGLPESIYWTAVVFATLGCLQLWWPILEPQKCFNSEFNLPCLSHDEFAGRPECTSDE